MASTVGTPVRALVSLRSAAMTVSASIDAGTFWFTLSLVNAGLAQAKGRSGLNWWLLSLLLGPLATALIVIWPPVRP